MNQNETFPFELGKIYPTNLDISKPWYIKYKVWHHGQGALISKKITGDINRIHNKEERLQAARAIRNGINELLKEGFTIGQKEKVKTLFKHLSIGDALAAAFEIKKASIQEGTEKDYNSLLKRFKKVAKLKGWLKFSIKQLNTSIIEIYLDELLKDGLANKTRNNHLGNIKALAAVINQREHLWQVLPGKDIKMLPTTSNSHVVYSRDQLQKTKQACIEMGEEYLWLFCQFMFYSLARPKELRLLKVEHLDIIEDRIYIPGESAKGRSGEWIDMYPPLKDLILQHKLHKAPPSWYVFSANKGPGIESVGKNYFYKRHREILKAVGLDKSERKYDLYSYKHSGCCHLYKAGVDLLTIQQQCRHKSPEQTMKYLRDLGMFRTKDHFSKVKAI